MISNKLMALAAGAALAFCLGPTGCEKTSGIPSLRMQVVDAETGEPQHLVRVVLVAYKTVGSFGGEYDDDLHSELLYFDTPNGEVKTPQRSVPVFDFIHYRGWEICVRSPGHQKIYIGAEGHRFSVGGGDNKIYVPNDFAGGRLRVPLKPWRPGEVSFFDAGEGSSLTSYLLQDAFRIEDFAYLLSHWDKYYIKGRGAVSWAGSEGPKEDLEYILEQYLRFLGLFVRDKDPGVEAYVASLTTKAQGIVLDLAKEHPDLVDANDYLRRLPPLKRESHGE